MCQITIFTPTYNRADKLMILYHSIRQQSIIDFEWIIVDDGSDDNTYEIVQKIINDCNNSFKILYIKQDNAGKHKAINTGVSNANGRLFFIVDSDDWLEMNAIERIIFWENSIINKKDYAGIGGLKCYENNRIIGKTFSSDFLDCSSLERKKYNIIGDKAEVFYTNILKKYQFPIFDGENFLSEYLVWYRIANDNYKIRWFNEKIYFCEYCENGLSSTTGKCTKNFMGFEICVKELIRYKEIGLIEKMQLIGQYGAITKKKKINMKNASKKIGVNLFIFIFLSKLAFLYSNIIFRRKN